MSETLEGYEQYDNVRRIYDGNRTEAEYNKYLDGHLCHLDWKTFGKTEDPNFKGNRCGDWDNCGTCELYMAHLLKEGWSLEKIEYSNTAKEGILPPSGFFKTD